MIKKDETTKPAAKKPRAAAKAPAAKKPRATAPVAKKKEDVVVAAEAVNEEIVVTPIVGKPTMEKGKYVFATGRRKTAIANVRMFSGSGEVNVNRKPLEVYFSHEIYRDTIMKPLQLTGLANDFYFNATINGGGIIAQAQALQHGLAQALASLGDDIRKVLKKNGMLTRDDRKKERKKPGLRGARRAPQWAKR
jgi:small subunit ribosomal protein S9